MKKRNDDTEENKYLLPTQEYRDYWIRAINASLPYPESTERCGKWMIFIPVANIDEVWVKIRQAVAEGKLGRSAKVATMRMNPNAVREGHKVICVYTYDSEDIADVTRILKALRELGIHDKMFYKEDEATLSGQYSFNSSGSSVSKYWVGENETALLVPKSRKNEPYAIKLHERHHHETVEP